MTALRLVAWFALLLIAPAIHAQAIPDYIRHYSDAIRSGALSVLDGAPLAAAEALPALYQRRGHAPAWDDPRRLRELLTVLRRADTHGLDPADYPIDALSRLTHAREPAQRALRDLLATDAFVEFARHLRFGKVDPRRLDPDWNLGDAAGARATPELFEQALAAPSLADFVERELGATGPLYDGLRAALARYRALAHAGGWPAVPGGGTLRRNDHGTRVVALRARLAVTDAILRADATDPAQFNVELEDAVERFQSHHGLDVDGVVGRRTLAALNVPAAARVDQLRVNLERTRWVFPNHEPRYLVVNIAGFHAHLVENGTTVWNARVQVGRTYRRTPVFKARMTYLVLNPSWTVPPTILKNDVIPQLIVNPDYLAENEMILLDRDGRVVPPDLDLLDRIGPDHFPYTVRRVPGPDNPLGRIKFMFPNPHSVYLHDTPSQKLFERADRSFSSGCIRIERPLELAERLFADPQHWSRAQFEERIATGEQKTVKLPKPISVFVMYWTAEPDADGEITFYNDIYERDGAVLEALNAPLSGPY